LGLSKGVLYKTAFEKSLLSKAVLGQISDDVWRDEITRELAKSYGTEKAAAAAQEWEDFPGLVNEPYLEFLVHRLPHSPIVILTNGTFRLKSDLSKLGLEKRFHRIVSSSEIGVSKPDKKVYQHVIEKLK
jgi:HAD superfamily hydrolase (TIGR01549 family)